MIHYLFLTLSGLLLCVRVARGSSKRKVAAICCLQLKRDKCRVLDGGNVTERKEEGEEQKEGEQEEEEGVGKKWEVLLRAIAHCYRSGNGT